MLGRFYESVNTEEALAEMQETTPYTQKWSRFVQQLSDALDNSERMHLDEVLTLMQQAPQELNMVLKRQPPNIVGNIFMFLVVVTPRRAGLSDKESQMFRDIVKSLLNYGATAVPACHPLSHMLRNLARWDTEDLDNFTENNATKCDKLWDLLSPGSPGRVAILNDCVHLSVSTPWLQINQSSSLTILQSQEDAPIKSNKISNYEWLTQRSGVDSSRSFPNGSGSNRNKPEDIVTWHITSEYTRNSGTFAVGNI
ncbi:hypothetical protein Daus18300_003896 [Diaporthe australafricana]|uniref:Uncharacterized protein n=1 Tax=Diaporthe australafricana TaxID=127596 RepID=A0ABR3XC71_9PEZI